MALVRYPAAMRRLINELSKLPTVGEKSATRLAYHLVNGDEREAMLLSESIKAVSYTHLTLPTICSV